MRSTTKKFRLSLLFLLVGVGAFAQEFARVDAKVKSYPGSYATVDRLASQINADFKSQSERARAAFAWIALNINYDNSPSAPGRRPINFSYKNAADRKVKLAAIENDLATKTLKSGKGVCHGYAMLYKVLSDKLGLESEVVYGTAKATPSDIGKGAAKGNHAWNVVKINGQWKLIDVTWGSGGISGKLGYDDKYFFTSPELFFLNHFPDDKKWLLTGRTESQFASLPLYYDLGYEMISPAAGVISAAGSKMVKFKIKGLKAGDDVVYQYTSGAYSHKVTPKISNGVGEFNIMLDNSARGTLTIFANKRSIAAYKIN